MYIRDHSFQINSNTNIGKIPTENTWNNETATDINDQLEQVRRYTSGFV